MTAAVKYRPPAGVGVAGRRLWGQLTVSSTPGETLLFSAAELVTLELACKAADSIAALEKLIEKDGMVVVGSKGQAKLSGAVAELRLQRAALGRLVGLLAMPADDESEGKTPTQRRAAHAADARWAAQASRRESRRHG